MGNFEMHILRSERITFRITTFFNADTIRKWRVSMCHRCFGVVNDFYTASSWQLCFHSWKGFSIYLGVFVLELLVIIFIQILHPYAMFDKPGDELPQLLESRRNEMIQTHRHLFQPDLLKRTQYWFNRYL